MSTSGNSPTTSKTVQTSTVVQSSSVIPQVTEKPDLDVLDSDTKYHIERLCFDTKDDGVIPYWSCLSREMDKIQGITQPNLELVNSDTKYHIERICFDTKDDGVIPYWSCLRKELKKIGVTPSENPVIKPVVVEKKVAPIEETPVLKSKPDLSGLHELTKLITEQYCESYKKWGIQDYWGCLYLQIEESKKVSLPDLGSVYGETREIIIESLSLIHI